jgi:uncharacterized membrane protein
MLIASGFVLVGDRWEMLLSSNIYFQMKLGAVLLLTIFIGLMDMQTKKMRKSSDPSVHMKKISSMGRITLPLSIIIVILAVLAFTP